MTTAEKIAVMQAFEDGEKIECADLCRPNNWTGLKHPLWNWQDYKYRIKPKEPHYLPYKDTEEMIVDYRQRFKVKSPPHAMPLIWVKHIVSGEIMFITVFGRDYVYSHNSVYGLNYLYKECTYLDGSCVGKLMEE